MKVFIEDVIADGEVKGKLYLESDSLNFMIREYNGSVNEKGVEAYKNHGYFSSVVFALNYLIEFNVKKSTAQTLTELRNDIKKIESIISSEFNWSATQPLVRVVEETLTHE